MVSHTIESAQVFNWEDSSCVSTDTQQHSPGGGRGGRGRLYRDRLYRAETVSPGAAGWIPLLVARRAEHSYLAAQSEARRAGPTAGRQERCGPIRGQGSWPHCRAGRRGTHLLAGEKP